MEKYICIDIGGTSIKHSIIGENNEILTKGYVDTEAYKGGTVIIDKIKDIVKDSIKDNIISGISISTAGIVDTDKGEIIFANPLIPDYTGTKLKEVLEKEFNITTEVENDVNCAGLSESFIGAGKGAKICVCLTIGTGIGGCIIIDNKIFHGFSNSACEVGYINVNNENFQDLAAASVLIKKIALRKNIDSSELDGRKVFELAKQGDNDCIVEIDTLVDNLATGIADIVYVINPELVILGGGIMAEHEYLGDRLNRALKSKIVIENIYKNTNIAFAQSGNDAGMLGAYYNFLQKHKNS